MKKILFFSVMLFLFSCGNHSNSELGMYVDESVEYDATSGAKMQQSAENANPINVEAPAPTSMKKIIRDGNLQIKVDDVPKSKTIIDGLLIKYGGYYSSEKYNNQDYAESFNLQVRIPSDNLDAFVAEVETGTGEITFKTINARDVTEEFIDLETRLENKRSYLKRYRELLGQAKTINEILEIEEKIRRIEEEIESAEGRLRYLSNQVGFSTLNITLSCVKEYVFSPHESAKFSQRLKRSLYSGWDGLIKTTLFIANLWPLWIFLILLFVLRKKFGKKRKSKKGNVKNSVS